MITSSKDRKLRSVVTKSRSRNESGTAGPQDRRTKYTRNSKTISGRLHDELVMMDIDHGKYFSLNPVATRIWDLLERPQNMDELCAVLIDEYDVEPEQCLSEVEEHMAEMVRFGLVLRQGE
jgi:hypothetical protein